jgi:hypothetical protein
MSDMPPRWAEALFRALLTERDREPVSGDLLEQYRDSVQPTRGPRAVDRWYLRQVVGYAWQQHRLVAGLLLLACYLGTWTPLFVVPRDPFAYAPGVMLALLAATSLALPALVVFAAGFRVARQSGSIASSALAGLIPCALASLAFFPVVALAMMFIPAGGGVAAAWRSFVLLGTAVFSATLVGGMVGALGGLTTRATDWRPAPRKR